jgi:RNA recognition motif-containing protein
MGKKLFVGNLSFSTTSADLESLFASSGTVESATVVTDRESGRSRGFGFVEMSNASEASKAIQELNGRDVGGRQINVSEAKEREPRSGGGGGRPGGGGGGRPGGGGGFGRRSY